MLGVTAKMLIEESHEFERRRENLEQRMAKLNEEFMKWKEGVLKFEHSEYCPDDNLGSDVGVCDRECIWTDEDENDIQRSVEQTNGEFESGGEPEEGGDED